MQVETAALVLRDKEDDSVIDVYPLTSQKGNVAVTYPHRLILSMDLLHEAIKGHSESTRKQLYLDYSNGKDICLEGEALYMADIGSAGLSVEVQQIDWDYVPPGTPDRYIVLECVEDKPGEELLDVIAQAISPVRPRRNIRRPEGNENIEFWAVYENMEDGTQEWRVDFEDISSAFEQVRRMNSE